MIVDKVHFRQSTDIFMSAELGWLYGELRSPEAGTVLIKIALRFLWCSFSSFKTLFVVPSLVTALLLWAVTNLHVNEMFVMLR